MQHAPTIVAIMCSFACSTASFAATPTNLRNADFKTVPIQGNLGATVTALTNDAQNGDWIGYPVKPLRNNTVCSGTWTNGRFADARLEHDADGMSTTSYNEEDDGFDVERDLYILMRVNNRRIEKLRLFTSDCNVKSSGSTIHWLDKVEAGESISFLTDLATREPSGEKERERLHERAVCAIALHDAPDGPAALQKLYENSKDEELRSDLVFWIGQTSYEKGATYLRDALRKEPSPEVREQIIFAISQDESQTAVEMLIHIARHDADPELREKAIFWLSQKASDKAGETLAEAAKDDPDQEVKEQAVFALSQLPPEQGIPLLIDVVRKNSDPDIREKAIFWLGQSDDPRVVTFFEEILTK